MRHWAIVLVISALVTACVVIVAKEGQQEDKPLINLLRKHMGLD